jgi:RND superfamily putative drug exporter
VKERTAMKTWATFVYRHRWIVIGLWVVGLVGLQAAAGSVGKAYNDNFSLPDVDSTQAYEVLQAEFPTNSNAAMQVVFKANEGTLADPANATVVRGTLAEVAALPNVEAVTDPLAVGAGAVSPDGTVAFADVTFDRDEWEIADILPEVDVVVEAALANDSPAVQVEVGGSLAQFAQQGEEGGGTAEMIGFLVAAVILAILFGTLVAAAIPLVTAVVALVAALAVDDLLSNAVDIAEFTPQLATLIGIGVGIDYALLLVNRYRNELHSGQSVEESVVAAVNTSGRAVFFAGITVCIALLGMLVLGVDFLVGVAVACSVAVAMTMFASLTFLPALLGVVGHRIDKLPLRRRRAARTGPSGWERWASGVQRRPVAAVLTGLIIVGTLAFPALQMRLGFSDTGTNATDTTTRQAYDILGEGFGDGSNGPFIVTSTLETPSAAASLPQLEQALRSTPGVAFVSPAQLDTERQAAIISLVPTTGPQEEATSDLLTTLRDDVVPDATAGTGLTTYVGGSTASSADFSTVLGEKLPYFIGVVVLLSMLLLLVVFRSVVIPLKAAAMNLLSIGAAFGIVTAVFQQGWFADLLGVSGTGPIEPFIPVLMFAILFGLSMDYEVFLVSRMHEEWVHTKDNARSVREGLASTGGVITAAATIMISVFGAFLLLDDRIIKIFGIGLAAAIFIDAFVIRSLIVPGVMFLVGKANWYLPSWMERFVPRVSIEGPAEEPVAEPDELAPART